VAGILIDISKIELTFGILPFILKNKRTAITVNTPVIKKVKTSQSEILIFSIILNPQK